MIQVQECRTADEVIQRARAVAERRRATFAAPALEPEPPRPVAPVNKVASPPPLFIAVRPAVVLRDEKPKAAFVADRVAEAFGVAQSDISSKTRAPHVVRARQFAMYLCRVMTDLSYPQIGAALGGFDHTTVLHGVRRTAHQIEDDAGFAARIATIRDVITAAWDAARADEMPAQTVEHIQPTAAYVVAASVRMFEEDAFGIQNGASSGRPITAQRLAAWMALDITGCSYPVIAGLIGLEAYHWNARRRCRAVAGAIARDEVFAARVRQFRAELIRRWRADVEAHKARGQG